jgi:hypothetical protein
MCEPAYSGARLVRDSRRKYVLSGTRSMMRDGSLPRRKWAAEMARLHEFSESASYDRSCRLIIQAIQF